jgi:hypothetical protein
MGKHQNEGKTGSSIAEIKCPHHWLIEPPKGPTSIGVCKMCGAIKEFDNQYSSQAIRAPQVASEVAEEKPVVQQKH